MNQSPEKLHLAFQRLLMRLFPQELFYIGGPDPLPPPLTPEEERALALRLKEFLSDEMPDALAVADVVLSRAGSNTLSELLALHKPMLLVPYPLGASRGDQIENAKSYARQGLARVLMQEDMTARTLTDALFKLLDERAELLAALEAYPVKDGTQAVLALIEDARKK